MWTMLLGCICSASFRHGQSIAIFVGNVGSDVNAVVQYPYYSLPYCRIPDKRALVKGKTLNDALLGRQIKDVGYHAAFGTNESRAKMICEFVATESMVDQFRAAVERNWVVSYLFGGIEVRVPVGAMDNGRLLLNHDLRFVVTESDGEVVGFDVIPTQVDLKAGDRVALGYSVEFRKGHRGEGGPHDDFFEHVAHSYALLVAVCLFVLLASVLAYLLFQMLRNEGSTLGFSVVGEENVNWKIIKGDVFRPPVRAGLLCGLAGWGVDCVGFLLAYAMLAKFGIGGVLWRGVLAYVLAALPAALAGCGLSQAFGYQQWARVAVVSVLGLPLVLVVGLGLSGVVSFVSGMAHKFAILPLVPVAIAWLFASIIAVCGGWAAMRWKMCAVPRRCELAAVERQCGRRPWWLRVPVVAVAGGFACWASCGAEEYFALVAGWRRIEGYRFGLLVVVALVTCGVAGALSCLVVLGLLQHEVHRWQWISFIAPSTMGCGFFLYGLIFLRQHMPLSGIWAYCYYLVWHGAASLLAGVACGGIGVTAACVAVRSIYGSIKTD